jgi:hypothetical protein
MRDLPVVPKQDSDPLVDVVPAFAGAAIQIRDRHLPAIY